MKKKLFNFVFSLCLLCIGSTTNAQAPTSISFEYDNAGNCTLKYKTVVLGPQGAKKNQNNDSIQTLPQKEMIGEREVLIYPNPTRGALKIEIRGTLPKQVIEMMLTDISGHTFASQKINESLFNLDMNAYPAGVYMLRIAIEGEQKDWKIVKK